MNNLLKFGHVIQSIIYRCYSSFKDWTERESTLREVTQYTIANLIQAVMGRQTPDPLLKGAHLSMYGHCFPLLFLQFLLDMQLEKRLLENVELQLYVQQCSCQDEVKSNLDFEVGLIQLVQDKFHIGATKAVDHQALLIVVDGFHEKVYSTRKWIRLKMI